MIKCLKCGGRLRVKNTYNQLSYDSVIRRLQCDVCGAVNFSEEKITSCEWVNEGGRKGYYTGGVKDGKEEKQT